MFCGHCGEKIENGERFCGNCGAPVQESGAGIAINGISFQQPSAPTSKRSFGGIAIAIVVAVVAIILSVSIFFFFSSKPYSKNIQNMTKALQTADSKLFISSAFAGTYQANKTKDYTTQDWKDSDESLRDTWDTLESVYGSDLRLKMSIAESETLKKSDFRDMRDKLESRDYYSDSIERIDEITIKMVVKSENLYLSMKIPSVYAVKTDEGWSLCWNYVNSSLNMFNL